MCRITILFLLALTLAARVEAITEPVDHRIRVGVLQFGTVNWELHVIDRHQLDRRINLSIDVVRLASTQALLTALQSGKVDLIVGDWIWAARQRQFGRNYSFFPYSSMAAEVVVRSELNIHRFEQLRHKRIGIAGGPVNKSWVLYRAYAHTFHGMDLQRDSDVRFAAAPLLNNLLFNGELDAVINFWHFSSRLKDRGLTPLLTMRQVLEAFDIDAGVPLLGWLFRRDWAEAHRQTLEQFFQVSFAARGLLQRSDEEWTYIPALREIESASLRSRLREDYRNGIPHSFGDFEVSETRRLFALLRDEGGRQLAGETRHLPDDLFWKSSVLSGN